MDFKPQNEQEGTKVVDDKFACGLYQMEVNRLNYIVTSYHRTDYVKYNNIQCTYIEIMN